MHGRGWNAWALTALTVGLALLVSGCERGADSSNASPSLDAPASRASAGSLSPAQVVRRVNEYRRAGRRSLIADHVVFEQRAAVLELIQAVDQLLAANEGLQQAVRTHLGPAQTEAFDLSGMSNFLGVFSHDVKVLDERIDGAHALVTMQVANRVPLDSVELVQAEGRWLIRTDPPVPGMAREVRNLAQVLKEGARALREKDWTAERLRDELAARQASINRRLAESIAKDDSEFVAKEKD